MNQQLSTYFASIQTERYILDRDFSRKWTTATAAPENDNSKSLRTLIIVVTTALIGVGSTAASLVRLRS